MFRKSLLVLACIGGLLLSVTATAQNGISQQRYDRLQERYDRLYQRQQNGRCGTNCQARLERVGNIIGANSVPELSAATAPLSALLLAGLLAAGVERRRRKSK